MTRTTPRSGTAVDAVALRTAVGAVEEPSIRLPLGELGLLREVTVDGRGLAHIGVVQLVTDYPLRDELQARVVRAARTSGASSVDCAFTAMSKPERMRLAQLLRAKQPALSNPLGGGPRIYAVASGKGGVGKSTITANLAAALVQSGQSVGVLDADVWGSSIPLLFGVHRNPVALAGMMLPVEAHGVRLMSVGFFVDDNQPVVWRGPMLHKAIEQFLTDVYWGDLDVLLIDLPPGTGDVALSLCELLPTVTLLIITTPQTAAHTVAARAGRMARGAGLPIAGVIENMSRPRNEDPQTSESLFGTGGGAQLAKALSTPLLGSIPLDVPLRKAGDAGTTAIIAYPCTSASGELNRIAANLLPARRSLIRIPLPLSVA
jgi:ATP-binding protein involved in chromosome partitioning